MPICFLYVLCSSLTSPPPPPPPPRWARVFPRRHGGGGVQKETISEGVGDCLLRFFFPGGLGEIGELFINNSFSVEQAINYFTVTGVSKQVLLFALIIFHLRSAKCFFFYSWLTR